MASRLNTKPAFISQVLSGKNDFALEHCPLISEILGHTSDEAHYFILLVLYARAGSKLLEEHFKLQIDEILVKRRNLLERIKSTDVLNKTDQALYYSQWHYSAIHLLTSIPEFQSKTAIARRVNLSLTIVSEAVNELVKMGLLSEKSGKYQMTSKRILLNKSSPWITQMHTHYRLRSIHKLTEPMKDDFRYSLGVSLSKKDFESIREKLLRLLEELDPQMRASSEEEAYCLLVDFFQM